MKTFGKILICIIVVLVAVGIAYLVYDGSAGTTKTSSGTNTNSSSTSKQNTTNNTVNNTTNETSNNQEKEDEEEFIGKEENKEEPEESIKPEPTNPEQQPQELTGQDKAIDIVKKQYALDGQTVRFDHMEGNDYIIKMNDGTAVTWYVVNGTTWEAEEY